MNGVLPENRTEYRQIQEPYYHFSKSDRLISLNELIDYIVRYQSVTFYSERYFKYFAIKMDRFTVTPSFSRSRQSRNYSRISQYFMKPEGSLTCSQEPNTGPYPEPDQSSPGHPILFL
jgi:hypothetical protein